LTGDRRRLTPRFVRGVVLAPAADSRGWRGPAGESLRGLRYSFGLHAIRSGVPLNMVQRWLGHASMHTTAIYLQAFGDEEREIAARMWVHSSK
jgi:integrase